MKKREILVLIACKAAQFKTVSGDFDIQTEIVLIACKSAQFKTEDIRFGQFKKLLVLIACKAAQIENIISKIEGLKS